MMLNDKKSAGYACLCQYSFDQGIKPDSPPPDPRLAEDGYALSGYIIGMDEVFGHDELVSYGYLAHHADGHYALVTRGTYDAEEWYEDILGKPTGYALGGSVHSGFFGVYNRFSLLKEGATARSPLIEGVAREVGQAPLVVVGHSLGGATAPLAAAGLGAELSPKQVSAALFEAPRLGNPAFWAVFEQYVDDYVSFASLDDKVPTEPPGSFYVNAPKTVWFSNAERQALIAPGVAEAHHVCGVAASLYFKLKDWKAWGGTIDADLVKIILGPAAGLDAFLGGLAP